MRTLTVWRPLGRYSWTISPRRSRSDAEQTRAAIIAHALDLGSLDGLEGMSIGRLARDLGLSKSGVLGHFGTKEELQLQTLRAAVDVFSQQVWEPSLEAEPGLPRLAAICDGWISYLEHDVFPGGCFLTAASCEFDGRESPVREAIAGALSRWNRVLRAQARVAVQAGTLAPEPDPETVAFQLNALAMGANQAIQLLGDSQAAGIARRAMRATLGLA